MVWYNELGVVLEQDEPNFKDISTAEVLIERNGEYKRFLTKTFININTRNYIEKDIKEKRLVEIKIRYTEININNKPIKNIKSFNKYKLINLNKFNVNYLTFIGNKEVINK